MENNTLTSKRFRAKTAFAFSIVSLICLIARILVFRSDFLFELIWSAGLITILGLVMFSSGIVGIILGIMALASGVKHICKQGYVFSIAAIIISTVMFGLLIMQIVLMQLPGTVSITLVE